MGGQVAKLSEAPVRKGGNCATESRTVLTKTKHGIVKTVKTLKH